MSAGLWLIVGLSFAVVGAVFSTLFYSLQELARTKFEELGERHPSETTRRRVRLILEDPSRHAIATALPRVVCNMAAVVSAVFCVTRFRGVAAPEWLEVILGIFAASITVWIVGLVIPSSIARHAGEEIVLRWSWLVRGTYLLTRPLDRVARFLDRVVGRMAGPPDDPQQDAQEEVMSAVAEGQEEGRLDEFEGDTIASVLRFRDITVQQIMTPRTKVEAIQLTSNLGEVTAHIRKTRHSRIPVYEGTLDRVMGIFYVKDLLKWLAGDKTRAEGAFDLRKLLRPALFVPETKTVREALADMREKKVHLAVVADEYGGTAGLITIEDIVEQIIGDIRDEFEPAQDESDVEIDSARTHAEVEARAYIHEANAILRDLGLELPSSEDYDTVGGCITVTLGRIPAPGEVVLLDGLAITIIEAEPTHVERVRIEKSPPAPVPVPSAVTGYAAVKTDGGTPG
ncbi:MAG: HlyC/CorC family transporter [Phycisphaeraceae bacterium]|nr:HlyC/CorC family transporter [Phycisphaerae bacterium]MBX3392500.1 HlyC/CorC family transporter [Phycisphaeraceae bacterium]